MRVWTRCASAVAASASRTSVVVSRDIRWAQCHSVDDILARYRARRKASFAVSLPPSPLTPKMLVRVLLRGAAVAALSLVAAALPAAAQETGLRVIVHAVNPISAVPRGELADIFLEKVAAWTNGQPVVPVDQTEDTEVRKVFCKRVLGRDVPSVKGYWQQAIFAGKKVAPLEKANDAEVAAFVAANPNAIGYVSALAFLPATVKVVRVEE